MLMLFSYSVTKTQRWYNVTSHITVTPNVLQVLQTGQEITELDSSGFITSSPTVFAGNIGEKKYILQVSSQGCALDTDYRTCPL